MTVDNGKSRPDRLRIGSGGYLESGQRESNFLPKEFMKNTSSRTQNGYPNPRRHQRRSDLEASEGHDSEPSEISVNQASASRMRSASSGKAGLAPTPSPAKYSSIAPAACR